MLIRTILRISRTPDREKNHRLKTTVNATQIKTIRYLFRICLSIYFIIARFLRFVKFQLLSNFLRLNFLICLIGKFLDCFDRRGTVSVCRRFSHALLQAYPTALSNFGYMQWEAFWWAIRCRMNLCLLHPAPLRVWYRWSHSVLVKRQWDTCNNAPIYLRNRLFYFVPLQG